MPTLLLARPICAATASAYYLETNDAGILQQLRTAVWFGKVTAYQVITNAGATGKMPTSVQFKISNPGDQAVSVPYVQT